MLEAFHTASNRTTKGAGMIPSTPGPSFPIYSLSHLGTPPMSMGIEVEGSFRLSVPGHPRASSPRAIVGWYRDLTSVITTKMYTGETVLEAAQMAS